MGESTSLAQNERTAAFVQRLRELGWIEGRTVAIEYRWAEGRSERFAEIATEFVGLQVDVIVTINPSSHRSKTGDLRPFQAIEGRADAIYVPTEPLVLTNRLRINTLALGALLANDLQRSGLRRIGGA